MFQESTNNANFTQEKISPVRFRRKFIIFLRPSCPGALGQPQLQRPPGRRERPPGGGECEPGVRGRGHRP